jgi:hypothetical protein
MRIIAVLLLCSQLSGCLFFYIPGETIDAMSDGISGSFGNYCIPDSSKVGDSIKLPDGSKAKVERISGPSSRCKDAQKPIRAELKA